MAVGVKWNKLNEAKETPETALSTENGKPNANLHQELFAEHQAVIQKIIAEHSQRAMDAIAAQIGTLQRRTAECDVQEAPQSEPREPSRSPIAEPSRLPVAFVEPESGALESNDIVSLQPDTVGAAESNLAIKPDESKVGTRAKTVVNQMQATLSRRKTRRSRKGRKSGDFMEGEFGKEEFVQKGVFADAEAMKQKLRKALATPTYAVENFYSTTGWCQTLARSTFMENLTLGVIGFNAVWIAVDVDCNDASLLVDADPIFQVVDNLFCLYFVVEICIRFGAFERKKNCLKDGWFVFDSFMAISMALETWVLSIIVLVFQVRTGGDTGDASLLKIFRLFRLVRMARVIRLLNALPELMVVIKGLAVATRAVSCTVILMLLVIYIFAIFFRQITDGTRLGSLHFRSVPLTMRFLLLHGTMADVADPAVNFFEEGFFYALMFLFFILMVTITIMNMLVGVLVGVVSTVANVEQEQLVVNFVKENLMTVLKSVQNSDMDNNGMISKEEFGKMLNCPEAIKAFGLMGVDVLGLVDLSDFIFHGGKELPFPDFIEMCMQLRGSNQATVKDIVDLRKFMFMELKFLTGMKGLRMEQFCDQPRQPRSGHAENVPRTREPDLAEPIETSGVAQAPPSPVPDIESSPVTDPAPSPFADRVSSPSSDKLDAPSTTLSSDKLDEPNASHAVKRSGKDTKKFKSRPKSTGVPIEERPKHEHQKLNAEQSLHHGKTTNDM